MTHVAPVSLIRISYAKYFWKKSSDQQNCLSRLECVPVQKLLEIGSYDAIDSSGNMVTGEGYLMQSVAGAEDVVNYASAVNHVDPPEVGISAEIGIQIVQGNKNVWGGFGQTIDLGVAIPSPFPPLKATAGFSLIFGADCNDNYKMGNLLGFGFTIGADISFGGDGTDQMFTREMSCGYVRTQTILENINNDEITDTKFF